MNCNDKDKNGDCYLDMGRGCRFCNSGADAEARPVEGCFKLHETDWLAGYPDNAESDIFEVRFKNTRRSYYRNVNGLKLKRGDIVAVESSPGHDIGIISLTGDMVARQMKRVGFNPMNGEFKKIYRLARPYDIEKWQEAIALEHETMIRSRRIAADMGLNMKIGDVEYQGDKIKAIFYYIADERVDFRELIKVFAEQFRIRVEMKQIGARQEAGRIGGIGPCGRELCCASWMSSFTSVVTTAARTQEISLKPQKLAGQCSKLKCCLAYELDSYIDARKDFPRVNHPLQTIEGDYFLVKSDILARTMSFSSSPDAIAGLVTLPIKRVKEILEANRQGRKVDSLQGSDYAEPQAEEPGFVNVIGEESITRFDKKKKSRSGRNRNRGGNGANGGNGNNGNNGNGGSGAKSAPQSEAAGGRGAGEERAGQRNRGRADNRPNREARGGEPHADRSAEKPSGGEPAAATAPASGGNRRRQERGRQPGRGGNGSAPRENGGAKEPQQDAGRGAGEPRESRGRRDRRPGDRRPKEGDGNRAKGGAAEVKQS